MVAGIAEHVECDAKAIEFGGLAQLGEHLLCKQGVVGSIPSSSTTSLGLEEVVLVPISVNRKQWGLWL